MWLIDWLFRGAEGKMDEQVFGTHGVARARFRRLDDEAELVVRASLGHGHDGTIALRAHPQDGEELRREGRRELMAPLGPGKPYRGTSATIDAHVLGSIEAGASPIALLSVEVSQRSPAHPEGPPLVFETFSVESRFDREGKAMLTLVVELG